MIDLKEIGRTRKSFGKEGALRIQLHDFAEESDLSGLFVFIERMGCPIPFKIVQHNLDGEWIKINKIDSPNGLTELKSKLLYLEKHDFEQLGIEEKRDSDFSRLIGVDVFLGDIEFKVGQLLRIEEFPHQLMAIIERNGQEILIPFHSDLIINDFEIDKVLILDLPIDIVELNTQE